MSRRRGEVITFYSFKGGVGRSMAVANLAAILAQHGKKVLVLDFDFEAPGLHRYFLRAPEGKANAKRFEPDRTRRGVIDLFKALKKRLRERLPPEAYDPRDPASQRELRAIVGEVLGSARYRYRIHLRNPNRKNGGASLDFIAAGQFDDRYVERVRSFGWKRFYAEYAEVFPVLADELAKRYDYILIDSRTGFTDIGSICTMVLPDKLVLVFTPNEQSLAGALDVGEQAVRQRASTPDRGPLPLFPLISRLEDSEEVFKRQWVKRATESFEKLSKDVYGLKRCDLEVYFDLARVPHRPYYAYGERIAAEEEKQSVAGSMAQGFKRFADCLEYEYAHEVRALPKEQEAEVERALLEKLDDEPSLREMIERNPDEVMLRLRLAELLRRKGRLQEAIEACDEVVSRASGSEGLKASGHVASALLMKAECFLALGRHEQEISIYDEVVTRFGGGKLGNVSEPVLREKVATALVNKGLTLDAMKRAEEAIVAHDDVLRRFGDATEPGLRELVAGALNSLGFYRLCEAKRVWQQGDATRASQILGEAEARIAAARERDPENPFILGNAGYIAFLLGRTDEARALLAEAIQRGGEDGRKGELADADIHALPQDEEFRALVRSL